MIPLITLKSKNKYLIYKDKLEKENQIYYF